MLGVTDRQIQENNVMIHDFMQSIFPIDRMEYESNWRTLIPVANKILKLINEDNELKNKLQHYRAFLTIDAYKNMFSVSDIDGQLHIESVYLRVVDFLKWLKTNQ